MKFLGSVDLTEANPLLGFPSGGGAISIKTDLFSATTNQTTFNLTDTPLTDGLIYVTRNGIIAIKSDYTLTDLGGGSFSVVFGTGLDEATNVQVCYWITAPASATPLNQDYEATEGQTDFTLSNTPIGILVVSIDGIVQKLSNYVIVGGTTLQLSTPVTAGTIVFVSYLY